MKIYTLTVLNKKIPYNRNQSNSLNLTKRSIDLPIWPMLSIKDLKIVIKII